MTTAIVAPERITVGDRLTIPDPRVKPFLSKFLRNQLLASLVEVPMRSGGLLGSKPERDTAATGEKEVEEEANASELAI